jgi:hypothetical protein
MSLLQVVSNEVLEVSNPDKEFFEKYVVNHGAMHERTDQPYRSPISLNKQATVLIYLIDDRSVDYNPKISSSYLALIIIVLAPGTGGGVGATTVAKNAERQIHFFHEYETSRSKNCPWC